MEFVKSKKYLFVLLLLMSSQELLFASGFSAKECLGSQFSAHISGRGAMFGLVKHELDLIKDDCVITIEETKYFFLKTKWQIDICREPIHLKREQFKNTDVYKKEQKCSGENSTDFCKKTHEALELFRNIGLIFAEGNRQELDSDHGKIYCSYLLSKEYLENDILFVSGQQRVYIEGLSTDMEAAPFPKKELIYDEGILEDLKEDLSEQKEAFHDSVEEVKEEIHEVHEEVDEYKEESKASGSF